MIFESILNGFWEVFLSILRAKIIKQSIEIFDPFLDAKTGQETGNLGSARRNVQGPWGE